MHEPSPLPWVFSYTSGATIIKSPDGQVIAHGVSDENADLILRAVNNHADLVKAVRGLLTCSLPHDISGQRIIEEARVTLIKAQTRLVMHDRD